MTTSPLIGEKPPVAPKPPQDGFYWVKLAELKGVYSQQGINSTRIGHKWEISEWDIVQVEGVESERADEGFISVYFIGSDETIWWHGRSNYTTSYVTELGPKINPPQE